MSGWIKVEKDLANDPRVLRMASLLRNADVTLGSRSRLVVVGALVTLWWYADTHIGDDDVLSIGPDEIDELVGLAGFCKVIPADWLQVIDSEHVKLVDYTAHSGSYAKNKALSQRRQENHRKRIAQTSRSRHDDALPDKTRQDNTKQDQEEDPSASATPAKAKKVSRETDFDWWLDFKLAYPDRAGDQGWRKAQRAAHARLAEGHTASEFIDGARRYAQFCSLQGKTGTEYVKQACTFLGPEKPFLEPWTPPASKGEARQNRNISASEQWLLDQEAKDAAH